MNNKGFTFIEILAVIVLIGILSSIAIIGVSRYRENAKNKDYEALAKSSYSAMEEYMMKNPYKKDASLETLENGSFLSNRKDPATKTTDCTGSVEVVKIKTGTNGEMDENNYIVYLCCTNYKKKYTYPEGKVEDYTSTDKCDYIEPEPDNPTPPTPGTTSYTLHYDDNGGSGCHNKTVTRNHGEAWGTLCTPTRNGYKFTGWKNGNTPVTATTSANSNITVKADWVKNNVPTYTCAAGKYLPAKKTNCATCTAGNYCLGGTWPESDKDQGLTKCPNCYTNSPAGSSKISQCYVKVTANKHVSKANQCPSNCATGYEKTAHNVNYGNTSTCSAKKVVVTFNCNGGSGGGTSTYTYGKANQKFNKTCTRNGYVLNGWKKPPKGKTRDYTPANAVKDSWINTNSPSIVLYAHWVMAAPNQPTVTNPYGDNWTNKNVNLKISTTSPTAIIGKWYYSYSADKNFGLLKDQNNNSVVGKQKFTSDPYTAERDQYTYIRVCNKEASGPTDTANCSKVSKVKIRIDKTPPTITTKRTWTGCSSSGFRSKEFGFRLSDNLSGFDISNNKTNFQLIRYYDSECNYKGSASWIYLNLRCSSRCTNYSGTKWLKSGDKSGDVDSGVLCGGTGRQFKYYMKLCDLAGNCSSVTETDYANQSTYC